MFSQASITLALISRVQLEGGGMTQWSMRQTRNLAVLDSSPTLATC